MKPTNNPPEDTIFKRWFRAINWTNVIALVGLTALLTLFLLWVNDFKQLTQTLVVYALIIVVFVVLPLAVIYFEKRKQFKKKHKRI